jgi:hypothetical protein
MSDDWSFFGGGRGIRRVTRATVFLCVCGLAAQLIGQYQVNMGGMNKARYQSPGSIRYSQVHSPRWSAASTMSTTMNRQRWAARQVAGAPQYGRYGTRPRASYMGTPGYRSRPNLYSQGRSSRYSKIGTLRYGGATGTRGLSRSSGYGGTRSKWSSASRGRSLGTIRY